MHFLTYFSLILATAIAVIATPMPEPEPVEMDVSARGPLGGWHAGWALRHYNQQGPRWPLPITHGSCQRLNSEQNDQWSSIEVFSGYECRFYRNIFCLKNIPIHSEGGEIKRTGPWKGNFASDWNDEVSSFKCRKV